MMRLIAYRLLQLPLILAIIYVITFLLVWVAPGDPFAGERNIDPAVVENLKKTFHADSALGFLTYYPVQILLHGNFGQSMQYKEWTVNDIIRSALPVSVLLGLVAMTIATTVGVFIGTMAAVRRGGVVDWLSLSVALIGISLPSFVMAALLLMLSASGPLQGVFAVGRFDRPIDVLLPGVALALAPMAYIARLTRVSMLDVLSSDFVRTARAKGLGRSPIIWKHCLKNAILPVLSYLGPAAAYTLTGSFVVEKVFNIPGLGQHFVNSVLNRDRTLILGVVLVYSAFVLVFNLLVDLAYGLVDPRIDLGGAQ
ncbi:MAG TPA: ABC transporter permease [Tepidisphaeraceae bacterium]|jgi:oligopeptide transport system permease protein